MDWIGLDGNGLVGLGFILGFVSWDWIGWNGLDGLGWFGLVWGLYCGIGLDGLDWIGMGCVGGCIGACIGVCIVGLDWMNGFELGLIYVVGLNWLGFGNRLGLFWH